jgi:hypothetical protein
LKKSYLYLLGIICFILSMGFFIFGGHSSEPATKALIEGNYLHDSGKMRTIGKDIIYRADGEKIAGAISFENQGSLLFYSQKSRPKHEKIRHFFQSVTGSWLEPGTETLLASDILWDPSDADFRSIPSLIEDAAKKAQESNLEGAELFRVYVGPNDIHIHLNGTKQEGHYYTELDGTFKSFQVWDFDSEDEDENEDEYTEYDDSADSDEEYEEEDDE